MRRSATPKQRRRPATKTLFRCGCFEFRVTKIRRQRVTPSVSCGRFDLRCTKIREEMIHLSTPPFNEGALKTKQKAAHTPDSIASSFAENDVEHITLYQPCLFTHTKYLYSGNDSGRKGAHFDLALDTWTATNLAKKEFFARQNKMAEASQAEKKLNSIAACIQCLATMDEITPDQYVKACESFRDKATRKMFMQMLPNMQMHWVRKFA
ncbi:unnamed protein product [Camellia sinensis]